MSQGEGIYKRVPIGSLIEDARPGFASGERDENGIIQVRMNNVTTEGKLIFNELTRIPSKQSNIKSYYLTDGDVLFNCTNSPQLVGKTARFKERLEPVVFSNHFIRLRVNKNKLDAEYLTRWLVLQWQHKIFEGMCTQWVNQASVRKERLLALEIPLPPLPEQCRIAAILDKADSLREKRRQAIAKLDELLKSVFIEMFGDPVTNPKGLKFAQLSNHIQLKGGFAFRSADYVNDGVPLVRIGEVNRGEVNPENAQFLPTEYLNVYPRFIVYPGDLLMSLTGTTGKDDYANAMLLDESYEKYFLNQRVALIQPDKSTLTREYLFFLFKDQGIKVQLTGKSRGIRQANISNTDILELKVPIPPLEPQNKFRGVVKRIAQIQKRNVIFARQANELFLSLQQRAFSGELFAEKIVSTLPLTEVA